MKQRLFFILNGELLYDSDIRDEGDFDVIFTEDNDIARELMDFGKPPIVVSRTITVEVKDRYNGTP